MIANPPMATSAPATPTATGPTASNPSPTVLFTTPTTAPVTLANCAHSTAATRRHLVYAAIGASDTVGVGATDPVTQGWVRVLCDKMPNGTQIARLGISGATAKLAVGREVPQAIVAKPDIISVWNVVNDIVYGVSLDDYLSNLKAMLDKLTAGTQAPILVGNVPDITNLPLIKRLFPAGKIAAQVTTWNAAITDMVGAYKGRVYLVDLHTDAFGDPAKHPEWVSGDGFHPTSAGYVQIANAYWQVIQQNKLLPAGRSVPYFDQFGEAGVQLLYANPGN